LLVFGDFSWSRIAKYSFIFVGKNLSTRFATVFPHMGASSKSVFNFLCRPEEYAEWNERVANWDTIVQDDVRNILSYYQLSHGIGDVGIFGFCWGGKISTLAASQMPQIKAAGLVHPSTVTNEMANDVQAPMYLFPCLDDPDMVRY